MFAYRRFVLRRQVIVNLLSGQTVKGVPVSQAGPLLVLRGAEILNDSNDFVPVDGEIIVDRSNVDFIQALGGDSWRSSKPKGALQV